MDFDDTPEEAAFRAEARAFLDANATLKRGRDAGLAEAIGADHVAAAKAWQAKKAAAGFAGITWPKRFGGRGGTPMQHVIYGQEEARYAVPRGVFEIGLGMCLPTLMAYAPAEISAEHVGPALRGETIWCQLFSEPAAGSDVAGLRTRAERDGEDWVVNGQKIWTSGAHFSDWGLLLTRTDPDAAKHAGLSMFFVDMHAPGVEVRRIRQISGTSNFNEVFFTDLRIPDRQRLGAPGEGWRVALTTLMHERLAIGVLDGPDVDDAFALARTVTLNGAPALQDSAVRERLAEWYIESRGLEYTRYRRLTALSRGEMPGPENSIFKLVRARQIQDMAIWAQDLLDGQEADSPLATLFRDAYLYAPGGRIAGGTDEVLRNIIAERVLGLPGDIRVDRDKPFRMLG